MSIRKSPFDEFITTVELLAMATFVAYMRHRVLPTTARRLNRHLTAQHERTATA